MTIIPLSYYQHHDALFLAKDLLGKYLLTNFDGHVTGGMIIETEAYCGPEDRAAHSSGGRRTPRNEVMYGIGGHAYVYFVYGMHTLFNIVTQGVGVPHGILIRAIKPEIGIDVMCKRRKKKLPDKTLTAGPGSVCQALGITIMHKGHPLDRPPIWLEDRHHRVSEANIKIGPRVGVDYAGEDALLPWRFLLVE
jgi:DNA-3-methyladenine glycosylase